MKILVPTKCIPDTDHKIVASDDGCDVVLENIPLVINPFDAVALEEAVRIRERIGEGAEVVALSIGGSENEQHLRTALAVGASRAIHVPFSPAPDPWGVAEILQAVVKREQPQLVIMGKQAADDDACQVGQFLAARLDWPQATFASRIELVGAEVIVDREVDDGIETIGLPLPAVITVGLRLNEPRYASLAGIMKARKTPLEAISTDDLGISVEQRVEVIRYQTAESRKRRERLLTVEELVERLTQAGGALHGRI